MPVSVSLAPGAPRWPRRVAALLAGAALFLAASLAAAQAVDNDPDARLDTLRKQVDTAQQALKEPDKLTDAELQRLRSRVLAAQAEASDIADRVAPQLAGVEARVAGLGTPAVGAREDADVAAQRALLAKNRSQLDAEVKLAKLISIESDQLAAQLATLRRAQFQAHLGERTDSILSPSFWSDLADEWPQDRQRLAASASAIAGAAAAAPMLLWLAVAVVIASLIWLPRLFDARLMRWLTNRVPAGRLRRSLHALGIVLRWTLRFGLSASILHAALEWSHTLPSQTASFVARLADMGWFTGFLFGLTSALVSARRPSWRLLPVPDGAAAVLRWFPHQLAAASLLAWLTERLAGLVNASLSMAVAANCVVALSLGPTVALALMRFERRWRAELAGASGPRTSRPVWMAAAAGINWLVLTVAIVSTLAGFVAFGSFAVKQVVWAAIVLGAAYLLSVLIDDALMAWLNGAALTDEDTAAAAQPPAGAADGPSFAQLAVLLSGLLRLMVALFALMLLLAPFGEGPADLLRRTSQWRDGISIGQVTLQPSAVLQAVAVLVLGMTAVRWLRVWLEDRLLPTTSLDPGMRASATSLFGYAGVVVAVALAMSALGIGLERIAWVASALSVGIGFGLQAVVQNFVSGLILLAERPVKVGDWVSLGTVEGDIRRINVRATEIQMGDRSTVIVPNSEFITKIVRNVTLADPLGLVQVKLPVPLGTDPEQVRSLLLAAFAANEDVLESPEPGVSLDGIETGQLQFSATGFVKSPRLSGGVKSALLFDVLARVKVAGIALSAPPTMLIGNATPKAAAGAVPVAAPPPVLPGIAGG